MGRCSSRLGAHLVQADRLAHSLMEPGEPVYNEVVRHFGREILNPDGSINRSKLAELAFGPPIFPGRKRSSRIAELNRIVHPAVIRSQEEWMQADRRSKIHRCVAIVEAALHFRSRGGQQLRPPDRGHLRRRAASRALRRPSENRSWRPRAKEVERRMAAQLPDEEKVKAADYVIDNSGSLEQLASK